MTFSAVAIEERKRRKHDMRRVKLKGYWDGQDRRGSNRLDASLAVKYFINGRFGRVRSVDISLKGIKLTLDEKMEKGTLLRLEIKLSENGRIVRGTGKIVWSKESQEDHKESQKRFFSTGIRFIRFEKNSEKELFDFIHQLQSQNFNPPLQIR